MCELAKASYVELPLKVDISVMPQRSSRSSMTNASPPMLYSPSRLILNFSGRGVSLAADVAFPDPKGYGDRKAVLVIRQNLDDDSKEAMLGEHGVGMIHLAQRSERGANLKDMQYRFGGMLANVRAKRVGIEKRGDSIAIFVSLEGEPMQQLGPPITLHFDAPFYVGIGFCSHLPDKSDSAVLSNVLLENSAGKVR